jgi:hypothetical protein
MSKHKKNLKIVIDNFIQESSETLTTAKINKKGLSHQVLESLAQKIWDLHHFAIELLENEKHLDESTRYNAIIIKDLTEAEIALNGDQENSISLLNAADETRKTHKDKMLRTLIESWAIEENLKEVLFDDLIQISKELAA